jgi:hypothetical protein
VPELMALAESQAAKLAAIREAVTHSSGMSDISVFIRILATIDGTES